MWLSLFLVVFRQAKRFNGTFDEYKKETAKETSKRVEGMSRKNNTSVSFKKKKKQLTSVFFVLA